MLSAVTRVCRLQLYRKPQYLSSNFQVLKRNTYVYRGFAPRAPKWEFIVADTINAFMWWWILVHCWYQYEHIIGHYHPPDESLWTDEELGIPPEEDD